MKSVIIIKCIKSFVNLLNTIHYNNNEKMTMIDIEQPD